MKEDPEQLIKHVGRRIAELREGAGLTQTELATRLGISPANLHRMERGDQNLTLRTMARVANALEVRVLDFLQPRRAGGQ